MTTAGGGPVPISPTPDHVPCRHCGDSISWDEVCWTHDATGFSDCGVILEQLEQVTPLVWMLGQISQEERWRGKRAEPAGVWT